MRRIELAYRLSAQEPATPPGSTWLRNPMMDVLQSVQHSGSISGAARALGLSYRHVWGQLRDWEAELGRGLVFWERGQAARLTPFGEALLAAERLAQARLAPQLDSVRRELERAFAQVLAPASAPQIAPTLRLHAGHDDALNQLVDFAAQRESEAALNLDVQVCGSVDAVRALSEGRCAIAGFHAPTFSDAGSPTARAYRPLLKPGLHRIIGFARRTQGLAVAPGNPLRLRDVQDIARLRARFVNRDLGTGTRLLFDELLARSGLAAQDIEGHDRVERSHAAVAMAVAGGSADAGLTTEHAARAARLDFVPISEERYLLACLKSALDEAPVQRLLQCLRSRAWQARMSALPGYQPDHCGEVAALKRLLPWWGG